MAVTLVEISAFDPVAGAAVTVRACNADDHRVTALNGVRWWPVLARAPQRRLDLFDGDFSGQIGIGIGDLDISTRAHPDAPRYSWGERAITIWRGPLGGAWGDYVQVFKGLTRPARGGNGRLVIGLRPDDRWMDAPLLATYAGTGGAEGPAELKGVPKPIALGSPRFVPGVLINAALNIWQLHNGAIEGVPVVYDRLARYSGAAFAGDDASYAALAAATIAPGAWRSCLALGLVRFGAPPAVPSFDVRGSNAGSYGWARRPGSVIGRIAQLAGASTGQIDATSLAALDTWAATLPDGGNISHWQGEQITARGLIQAIAASCNAAAGIGFDGRLFVARAGIGSPSITLAADGSRLPAVADVQLQETAAPFWRLAMAAEITHRVHGDADYGQIGSADQINYPDGTPVSDLQPGEAGATNTAPNAANRVPFSRMEGGRGWAINANASGLIIDLRLLEADGLRFPIADVTFTAAGQTVVIGGNVPFPVHGAERLSMAAGVDAFAISGADPASWRLYADFIDEDDVPTQETIATATGASSTFTRRESFETAPATTRRAVLQLQVTSGGAGVLRMGVRDAMVASAAAGQTLHPAFTPGPNASDGADVTPDRLPVLPQGNWALDATYVRGQLVQFAVNTYVCQLGHTATTGNAPPNATYWALFAAAGDGAVSGTASGSGATTNSTSYGSVPAIGPLTCRAGGTGAITISNALNGFAEVDNGATYGVAAKLQRDVGGVWTDVEPETSIASLAPGASAAFGTGLDATITGLSPGTTHDFRLLIRRLGAGPGGDIVGAVGSISLFGS